MIRSGIDTYRCRKKAKRVERKGTMENSGSAYAHQQTLAHTHAYASQHRQPYPSHSYPQSHPTTQTHSQSQTQPTLASSASPSDRDLLPASQNGSGYAAISAAAYSQHANSRNGLQTQPTLRSPSPSVRRPAYGIAVSSERGGAVDADNEENGDDDDEMLEETQQVIGSGSQTPIDGLRQGSSRQSSLAPHAYVQPGAGGAKRRLPSPPYIDSIPTHEQDRSPTVDSGSPIPIEETQRNGGGAEDEDVEMHSDADVDAALASAAAISPDLGATTKVKVRQATSDARTRFSTSPAPAPPPSAGHTHTSAPHAKFLRKKGLSVTASMPDLHPQAPAPPPPPASAHSNGNGAKAQAAGTKVEEDLDADADGDADAEIMDAVDAASRLEA